MTILHNYDEIFEIPFQMSNASCFVWSFIHLLSRVERNWE